MGMVLKMHFVLELLTRRLGTVAAVSPGVVGTQGEGMSPDAPNQGAQEIPEPGPWGGLQGTSSHHSALSSRHEFYNFYYCSGLLLE